MLLSMGHLSVKMIPRNDITEFSMSLFDGLFPSTAPSVVTSALHISATRFSECNDCRLRVALQRNLAITKQTEQHCS